MKLPVHIFKALADETRLRIIALLLMEGELCVCDIIASIRLPQSTVSRHLAYLRRTGMVKDRRCGLWMYYSMADNGSDFQNGLIEFLKPNIAALPTTTADAGCLRDFAKVHSCT